MTTRCRAPSDAPQGCVAALTRLLVTATALLSLAACKTSPINEAIKSLTTGPGTSAGASSAEPQAPAQQQTAGTSAEAVTVGTSKKIVLSSFEGDITCTRIVAPYDTADNVAALTDLASSSAVSSFGSWLEGALSGKPLRGNTQAAGASARHNIPYQVRATALRMNWLPMKAELTYGRLLMDKMKDDMIERDSTQGHLVYPVADRMLADVLTGVTDPHSYEFEVFVRAGSGENAMALPGGFLILDAALVKDARLRNKALFGLAHEVAHVLQRHETRALQARIIDAVSLRGTVHDLVKSIRSMRGDPTPLFQLTLQGKVQFEKHFSSQELHSDGCAVRVLDKVLDNKTQLAGVLQSFVTELTRANPAAVKLETPAAQRTLPMGLQSTGDKLDRTVQDAQGLFHVVSRPIDRHPAPKERIDNLNKTLREVVASAKMAPKGLAAPAPPVAPPVKTISLPAVPPPPKKR